MAKDELAPLVTRLEARTARFEKQLEKATRKVDQTTGTQERRWKKHHKSLDSRFKKMGKSLAKGLGVGTVSVGALTAAMGAGLVGAVKYASALDKSAILAGIKAERIQELTFASVRYGISQEKLSDILKDTNDKFGDFYATGAGPLADFFDNIAPKIGLTADSFKNLSSDQALGLYVSSLEKAGASQQDMTFYMEALASDSTALLPLLRNNSRELNNFAKEARDAGIILDNEAVSSAVAADRALTKLGETVHGNVRAAFIEAAPEIEELAVRLEESGPRVAAWFKNIVTFANDAADGWGEAFGRMNRLGGAILAAQNGRIGDAKTILDLGRSDAQIQEEIARLSWDQADNLKKQLELKKWIAKAEEDGNQGRIKASNKLLKKFRAQSDAIIDQTDKLKARLAVMDETAAAGPDPDADMRSLLGQSDDYVRPKDKQGSSLNSNARADAAAEILAKDLEAIRELGKTESEQIELLKQQRIESIRAAGLSSIETAELVAKVEADAAAELKTIAEQVNADRIDAAEKLIESAEAGRDAKSRELELTSEIASAVARMHGRTLEAIQIESDAQRKRYLDEIENIKAVQAERAAAGLDPDGSLVSASLTAQAGLANLDASEAENKKTSLQGIQGVSNGASGGDDTGLDAELERIANAEKAKLEELEKYRSTDLELMRAFEEEKTQIQAEFDEKRQTAKQTSFESQIDATESSLSKMSDFLNAAGLQDTKAAKAAAKAQAAIAIGRVAIDTAKGIGRALGEHPFPLSIGIAAGVGALGAAQIAAIASQSFDGGGMTSPGSRSGGVDGKGGFHAILHPNEVVADMTRPGREVAGRSLQDAFGLDAPDTSPPSFKPGQFSTASQSSVSVGGASITINGAADDAAIARLEKALADDRRNRAKEFNRMANVRDKRLTSRQNRRVGVS